MEAGPLSKMYISKVSTCSKWVRLVPHVHSVGTCREALSQFPMSGLRDVDKVRPTHLTTTVGVRPSLPFNPSRTEIPARRVSF